MKRKRRKISALICLVTACAVVLGGCATYENFKISFLQKKTEEVVRIGIFEPMSGADKESGELEIRGIELAHELFPEALGKRVELIYSDNKSDVFAAEAAATKLVENRVAIVLGSFGNTVSLTGGDIFKKAKIPAIAVTCTNPLVTSANDYYFRVCFVDAFQGNAAAKFVNESLGYNKAAILKQTDDDYASAMAQMFSDKLTSLTGTDECIADTLDYEKGAVDFTAQLEKIKELGVPLVYLPSDEDTAIKVLTQAKKLEVQATFLGTDNWDQESFIKKGGAEVEGATFTTLFDAESNLTEMSDVFLKAYREKYGTEEEPESAVALGFDAYLMAVAAINDAGTALDSKQIRASLHEMREFQGATGSITLNSNGDPIKSVVIKSVENGAFIHKYTAEPTWGQ